MKTLEQLQQLLAPFGGQLDLGRHKLGAGRACGLELLSVAQGQDWTDDPFVLGIWDLRFLNDAFGTDEARTQAMLPVLVAYQHCRAWPLVRQQDVAERLVVNTVRELVAELPAVPEALRAQCREVRTLPEAPAAADALAHALDAPAVAWVLVPGGGVASEADAVATAVFAAVYAIAIAAAARDVAHTAFYAAHTAFYAAAALSDPPDAILARACALWVRAVPA